MAGFYRRRQRVEVSSDKVDMIECMLISTDIVKARVKGKCYERNQIMTLKGESESEEEG